MCGITGLINLDGSPVSSFTIKKMTDAIAHRGLDGEGQWVENNIGIGHRRLAIIDLSLAAKQPMISEDRRYVLSYNGEIYNYKQLRLDLQAEGVLFNSNTDSEVVLYSLVKWGTDALLKFNGMFAIALWDRKQQKLLLARDRYGIKPLYYAFQGNSFAFGSEQKAILAQHDFRRKINKPALLEYFTFQNFLNDETLLEDIHIVPAGHYATIEPNRYEPKIKLRQYWDYCFSEPTQKATEREYLEQLDYLFNQAVNRQLVGDVELGCYLSAGIDSGSITSIASRNLQNLKTFTVGFDLSSASGLELGFDERVPAEAMSALFRTEHYEMVLKAGDMERSLPNLAWHLEEPRVGQSYPNYYAAKLASKFVKVVLSGIGGDELFGGYPWRYYRAANVQNFEEYIQRYYLYWQRLVDDEERKNLFAPIWNDVQHVSTRDIFRDVFKSHDGSLTRPEDYINQSLYFEAKTFLHGLLVVEDKVSMAHGIENRVPFLDNDLVEFAMQCPVGLKLKNLVKALHIDENEPGAKTFKYFQKTSDGKRILHDMSRKYVPDEVSNGIKKGFSSPDASWFKGDSIDFVRAQLFDESAPIYEYLNYHAAAKKLRDHIDGKKNRRLLIWSLLNVNQWIKNTL